MTSTPIRYTKSSDVNIAYQVTGRGARNLVLVSGWVSHLQQDWGHPAHAHFLNRLASFSRLIRFDKRGTGLSDRNSDLPDLETRTDDVRAVMDAAHCPRATIFGYSEGGPMAILFAATFPERVESLVIYGSYARRLIDVDYPWGYTPEAREQYAEQIERDWGWENDLQIMCPNADTEMAEWWGERARAAASPGAARALIEMNSLVDVRPVLPTVQVPTLVLHRTDDKDSRVDEGRYIAKHIPGAKFIELEGEDHFFSVNPDQVADEIEAFVTGKSVPRNSNRRLATVLFVDIVDSTAKASAIGDQSWTEMLKQFMDAAKRNLEDHRGQLANTTGDGLVATFDGPARAIRCGCQIREASRTLGLEIRCGIHTSEIEEAGENIAGIGVHIAARISQAARDGEVWTSRTVKDLVSGSGIGFSDRGDHELKGLDGRHALLAAEVEG